MDAKDVFQLAKALPPDELAYLFDLFATTGVAASVGMKVTPVRRRGRPPGWMPREIERRNIFWAATHYLQKVPVLEIARRAKVPEATVRMAIKPLAKHFAHAQDKS